MNQGAGAQKAAPAAAGGGGGAGAGYTMEEVAKHTTKEDCCWISPMARWFRKENLKK